MLTALENEKFTQIEPGTRMGALLRRYWHPIAALDEMTDRWTKRVRILGEDLVLFKDRSDRFGLVEEFCPHRRASLAYGIPTDDGIRCPYHGWEFNGHGQCIDQPNETPGSTFKDKIHTPGYPVEELAGLLFAYLGPLPAPLIPRYDALVEKPAIRMIGKAVINCNWLQIMENAVDPIHTEWLHGLLYEFIRESEGAKVRISRHHERIAFDEFEYGIIKRRLLEGQSEESSDWQIGHPLVFPNILALDVGYRESVAHELQFRVPIDDKQTMYYWYNAYIPPAGTDVPQHLLENVPVYDVPFRDASGNYMLDLIHGGDIMAWETQGGVADRSREHLGASDRGITMLRRVLMRELEKAERGEDPICIIRDPAANQIIRLPYEHDKDMNADGFERFLRRTQAGFSPIAQDVIDIFTREPAEAMV